MSTNIDWSATGSMISASATVVAVVVAIVGAWIALHQIAASKAVAANADVAAREAAALAAWNDYLRLCFDNPNYASADQAEKVVPTGLKKLEDNPSAESEKYQWFLSIVLNSCEQVLLGMPNVREWRDTLVDQVYYHAQAIEQFWKKWKAGYSQEMQAIVEGGLKKAADERKANAGKKSRRGVRQMPETSE